MAAYLNPARRVLRHGTLAVLLAGPAAGWAESLVDPTRPPTAMGHAQTVAAAGTAGGPQLQSVLISPQRRVAIIDGETVKIGDVVGEARVTRILETEVILRAGSEVRVLRLYPDIEKKSAAAHAGTRANKHKQ